MLQRFIRPLIPNIIVRIPHVIPHTSLRVGLRHGIRLVMRGATSYEPWYVELFNSLIRPDETVVDVGANIGFYSVLFSRCAARVVAYEPDPENLRLLERNLRENDCQNALIRPFALGDSAGTSSFSRDLATGYTGHLGSGLTYSGVRSAYRKRSIITVHVTRLDDEVRALGLQPNLLKLDVEGGEHGALAGAANTLSTYRPLVVTELSDWTASGYRSIDGPRTVLRLLAAAGYEAWDLDRGVPVGDEPAWMIIAIPFERRRDTRLDIMWDKLAQRAAARVRR